MDLARKRTAVAAPHANGNAAASAHASTARSTLLHALDLCGGTWRELPVSGHPGFDHAEALTVTPDGLLVALGWSAPRAGSKRDTPMQVAALKLGDALRGIGGGGGKAYAHAAAVAWGQLQTRGHVPTARTSCASVLLKGEGGAGPRLIVTGGVLCSPAVKVRSRAPTTEPLHVRGVPRTTAEAGRCGATSHACFSQYAYPID